MIKEGLSTFEGKRVLLLQGPLGPFFKRLARDLKGAGAEVYKINFNGGDWLFYATGSTAYRKREEDWPEFFEQCLTDWQIDVVLLFGDCRSMHQLAHKITQRRGVEIGVFEEGYERPDYITLERFGVNGNSLISRDPAYYQNVPAAELPLALPVNHTFWFAATWAMLYYLACTLLWPLFPFYRHHRPLTVLEGLPWLRAFWRKAFYSIKEKGIQDNLISEWSGKYFLVPLQVHNDAQIHVHSDFASVKGFIRYLIHSFASDAPDDTVLVIKHHPMDRGYHDYNRFIARLTRANGVEGRVKYVHDQHLPTLLEHARGVVLINSTVGLSALHHGTPLKVCGAAIYDIAGLTYQGALENFWKQAESVRVDKELLSRFRRHLIEITQLNGSFYKRLNIPGSSAGLLWRVSQTPSPLPMSIPEQGSQPLGEDSMSETCRDSNASAPIH